MSPLRPGSTSGPQRVVVGLAVAALAAGGTLIAIGLREPSGGAAVLADAVPVAVARPDASSGQSSDTKSYVGGVRLAAYNPAAGTALLASSDSKATSAVQKGDVIASPPSKAAPNGALFKVATLTTTSKGVEVTTEPATLSDALGNVDVKRTFAAKDLTMSVTPLTAGVRPVAKQPDLNGATTTKGPTPSAPVRSSAVPSLSVLPSSPGPARPRPSSAQPSGSASVPAGTPTSGPSAGAPSSPSASASTSASASPSAGTIITPTRTADGGLLLSLDIPLSNVPGIKATSKGGPKLAGWVGLTPKLVFSFGQKKVDGAKPFQAEIGVGGTYTYGWQVHAALDKVADTGEQAVSVPFATVNLSQTFFVGPVPVVLSVTLAYFYRVTATGDVSIDTEQSTTGEFAVGAAYDSRTGWGPLNRNKATSTGDATPVLTGQGDLRATVGADLTVLLYDSAGLTGRLAPYVRAALDATHTPTRWGVYAGFDITTSLSLQLKIFGITILKAQQALPPIHTEWKVAATTPEPAATSS